MQIIKSPLGIQTSSLGLGVSSSPPRLLLQKSTFPPLLDRLIKPLAPLQSLGLSQFPPSSRSLEPSSTSANSLSMESDANLPHVEVELSTAPPQEIRPLSTVNEKSQRTPIELSQSTPSQLVQTTRSTSVSDDITPSQLVEITRYTGVSDDSTPSQLVETTQSTGVSDETSPIQAAPLPNSNQQQPSTFNSLTNNEQPSVSSSPIVPQPERLARPNIQTTPSQDIHSLPTTAESTVPKQTKSKTSKKQPKSPKSTTNLTSQESSVSNTTADALPSNPSPTPQPAARPDTQTIPSQDIHQSPKSTTNLTPQELSVSNTTADALPSDPSPTPQPVARPDTQTTPSQDIHPLSAVDEKSQSTPSQLVQTTRYTSVSDDSTSTQLVETTRYTGVSDDSTPSQLVETTQSTGVSDDSTPIQAAPLPNSNQQQPSTFNRIIDNEQPIISSSPIVPQPERLARPDIQTTPSQDIHSLPTATELTVPKQTKSKTSKKQPKSPKSTTNLTSQESSVSNTTADALPSNPSPTPQPAARPDTQTIPSQDIHQSPKSTTNLTPQELSVSNTTADALPSDPSPTPQPVARPDTQTTPSQDIHPLSAVDEKSQSTPSQLVQTTRYTSVSDDSTSTQLVETTRYTGVSDDSTPSQLVETTQSTGVSDDSTPIQAAPLPNSNQQQPSTFNRIIDNEQPIISSSPIVPQPERLARPDIQTTPSQDIHSLPTATELTVPKQTKSKTSKKQPKSPKSTTNLTSQESSVSKSTIALPSDPSLTPQPLARPDTQTTPSPDIHPLPTVDEKKKSQSTPTQLVQTSRSTSVSDDSTPTQLVQTNRSTSVSDDSTPIQTAPFTNNIQHRKRSYSEGQHSSFESPPQGLAIGKHVKISNITNRLQAQVASLKTQPTQFTKSSNHYSSIPRIFRKRTSPTESSDRSSNLPDQWSSVEELLNENSSADVNVFTPLNFNSKRSHDKDSTNFKKPESPRVFAKHLPQPKGFAGGAEVTTPEITSAPTITEIIESPFSLPSDGNFDMETLAREIYHRLRQRLEIERERHGIYSGRLPW